MAWIEKLFQTYEACNGNESSGTARLIPIGHTSQQAHIEITIDDRGNFQGATVIAKEETVIPATEQSAGRTSGEAPHPLCDKIQYCAGDYAWFGGEKRSCFGSYEQLLTSWCRSEFSHPKARAVLAYITKATVVSDLVREGILHLDGNGKLLTEWKAGDPPEIFRLLTAKSGKRDQGDALVRWQVWLPGERQIATSSDSSLQEAWARFDGHTKTLRGVCMVTGSTDSTLAVSHPKRLRHAGDGAKLISANDEVGYTFRGRFTEPDGGQACTVGYDVTQKAHSALRWLIQRQAFRNGDQVIVTWTVPGTPVPDPFRDTLAIIQGSPGDASPSEESALAGDAGQFFALQLRQAMQGYRSVLRPDEDVVVMGLDSATPGRMAISYYRELKGSEFLDRIEKWHASFAWPQNFGRSRQFVGAPTPRDIAEAAYGRRLDDRLRKTTIERLLPCIIDGQPFPRDLVRSTYQRVKNRAGIDRWDWEKCLGIACALFRGLSKADGREYRMSLDEERNSRDYLYGRLLAVADNLEGFALTRAEANRDTTAGRLMQRFADRPFSTWRTIELALTPYKSRLRSSERNAAFLWTRTKLLDEIQCRFEPEDFASDRPLSAEFLLGFHCQRAALLRGSKATERTNDDIAQTEGAETVPA